MLADVKLMLGIGPDDTTQDEKLHLLISGATARLRRLLGGLEPPEEMEDIIREVTIIRFNRIGSEGMESHTVEGESHTFTDDDFAAYKEEIQDFLNRQQSSAKGRVKFL